MENLPGVNYNFRDFFKFMNYEHFLPLEESSCSSFKIANGFKFYARDVNRDLLFASGL